MLYRVFSALLPLFFTVLSRPAFATGPASTLCLQLSSKDKDATLEILKVIVREKGGKEVDEYIIDMSENKVFKDNNPESMNQIEVEKSSEEGLFEVEDMKCGGEISKACGHIQLPANYHPGLKCLWTFTDVGEAFAYTIDPLKLDTEDQLTVDGKVVDPVTGKAPVTVSEGQTLLIKFEAGPNSKRQSQMKFSFEKEKAEEKGKSEGPSGSCCPFYFKEDTIPPRFKAKLGGKEIFQFEKFWPVKGEKTEGFLNRATQIYQKKSRVGKGNFWSIPKLAGYQYLEPKTEIKGGCPTEHKGWQFSSGNFPNMEATCATEAELKEAGICTPLDYWDST